MSTAGPPDHPVDDWRPGAPLPVLRLRARLLARIRDFFAAREVLEVETPALSCAATTDLHLHSLSCSYRGPHAPADGRLYLHTSPEFPMKRLLAAGSGSIYQVCKVYRDGEAGRLHNPEFSLLEWYRVGFDHQALMGEVADFLNAVVAPERTLGDPQYLSYREAFMRHAGIDPFTADASALAITLNANGVDGSAVAGDRAGLRDLLITSVVEPRLGRGAPCFLYDYPADQAALARLRPGDPPVAERFELYFEGVELANGFHELKDAAEQRARMQSDLAARAARGLPTPPMDERLLAALAALPDCAGVALGLDRLVMIAAGLRDITQVLAFPIDRA